MTFESINGPARQEDQRQAVDTALKNIYEMIRENAEDSAAGGQYRERLFLPNSRDLVRLLVSFNMVQFHSQLK